jgi:4-alpha-glucanotransferase
LLPQAEFRCLSHQQSVPHSGPARGRLAGRAIMDPVTDPELIRRAEAAGIAPAYRDWRDEDVAVSDETLIAILDALGEPGPPDPAEPAQALAPPPPLTPAGTPADGRPAPAPSGRSWGFAVQLYSLRSQESWGHGDLRDLADLAAWSARELGAGFVLINPLHAAEPLPPVSASPYLPMTRRFTSPLYLRVADIPEYSELTDAQRWRIDALGAPLRARNATSDLIDRDEVWTAKRAALEIIYAAPRSARREERFRRFREREGAGLAYWAAWCAFAEIHGPDWRTWPAPARDSRSAVTETAAGPHQAAADFHTWLQWVADEQLAAAQQAAVDAGMPIGIIHDLAVGAHPGGADAWANADVMVRGMSVGAPPDRFNQLGQDWGQPPWHPQRLAAAGYRPLADLFEAALRHSGGMRADHVMGLMRLWWVPEGMTPDQGAYVRYDHTATVGALAAQARRAGALAIGEDLGTVDPWIREYLAQCGILGTTMLWFAREPDGSPLRPGHFRRACMATVGTHDLPPVTAFLTGEQVTVRSRLGLLVVPEDLERKNADLMIAQWRDALEAEGLIPEGARPGPDEFTVALYAYLARTPAELISVSLADAVGDRRAQNLPGTSTEYPNWQIPLCGPGGRAVLLENLPAIPLVRAVAQAATPLPH